MTDKVSNMQLAVISPGVRSGCSDQIWMDTNRDGSGPAIDAVAINEPTKIPADFLSLIRPTLTDVINFDLIQSIRG